MARGGSVGGFLKGILLALGIGATCAGGWMQTFKPDYRRVYAIVPVGPPPAKMDEPQPVPGSLIATCFLSGLLLLGVGIATK